MSVAGFINFVRRADVKLALFGVAVIGSVYFGFIALDVGEANVFIRKSCYYFLLLTLALWLWSLWQIWRNRDWDNSSVTAGEIGLLVIVIGLYSVIALTSDSFRSKILNDEFVLQSTAYNMHYFRDTATMARGYEVLGVFVSTDSYLDKRPNFFPFLISLVHDFTGYRVANAFWLNASLLPVCLSLVYFIGRRLNGPRGGLLALVLLGSLPLLGQNATGSGMELLNVVMILSVVGLAASYLAKPDLPHLVALVFGSVLLAQTRYESALYVLPVAGIILISWWRERKTLVSWPVIIAPLLLLPCALQNKVLSGSSWMWELRSDQETRFSSSYFQGNLQSAFAFFANTSAGLANSWALSLLGAMAVIVIIGWMLLVRRPFFQNHPLRVSILLMGLGVVANAVLLMFYYWSSLTDPMASRFSLPLYCLLALLVVMAAALFDGRGPVSRALTGVMLVFSLGVTTAHSAQHLYSHLGIDEIEWGKRYVAGRAPGDRLILYNNSPLPWLIEKTPCILLSRARQVGDRLQYQLKRGTFREILVFQALRPTSAEGDFMLASEDRLPDGFELEPLYEKRFGVKIVRVSRLLSVTLPSDSVELVDSNQ